MYVPVMGRRAAFEDAAGDYGLVDRGEVDGEFTKIAAPMHDTIIYRRANMTTVDHFNDGTPAKRVRLIFLEPTICWSTPLPLPLPLPGLKK